jgi:hypothetical protein
VAQIRSGPAIVLDTGLVTGFGGHPIHFTVTLNQVPFLVALEFHSDGGEIRVETRTEADGLVLTCVNFDSAEGRGSSHPVLLGEAGEDLLWMHFKVFRYGRTDDRTVHYTFFRAAKADVGWTPLA